MTTLYPGYSAAWGSTKHWPEGRAGGPYVRVTYTPPDEDGMSVRTEVFGDEPFGNPKS